MITTEKALNILPHVVEVYEKLNVDAYIKKVRTQSKNKKVDQTQVGIELFKFILKNIGKAQEEIFTVVAALEDKEVEEIKNQSLAKTIASIKQVFEDKELLELFKSAM